MPDFVHPFDSYEPAFEVNRSEVRVTEAGGAKGSGRRGPDGGRPSDGAGHPDVPQLCQPGVLRQAQRRLADVGAENAAGDGCVHAVGAAGRNVGEVGVQALACREMS